jgi:hypothetical protein
VVSRATGPLLIAYLLVTLAGIFFLITPSLVLAEAADYNELLTVWGLFYLVGGLVSTTSLLSRSFLRKSIALWYFEVSGLALIITANIVYAYALGQTGLYYREANIVALGLVLIGFSAGLVARCIETLRLVKLLGEVHRDIGG